ncbi:MAG: AI-2E family transporter, partial [Opitutales bacterium]
MSNDKEDPILTPRQRNFLGFVACFAAAWLLGFLLIGLVWVLQEVFAKFSGVIWSLAVAGMLAIMLRPIVAFFDSKFRLGRFISIMLLYLLVVGVAGAAIWLVGGKVVEQARELAVSAVHWPAKIERKAEEWLPEEMSEAVSGQLEFFKDYWNELFGVGDTEALAALSSAEREALDDLQLEDRKVFLTLDDEERKAYLDVSETDQRATYLTKKAEEIRSEEHT